MKERSCGMDTVDPNDRTSSLYRQRVRISVLKGRPHVLLILFFDINNQYRPDGHILPGVMVVPVLVSSPPG